ncbi:MAG: hypothetical protein D6675_02575 [Gemmatimonadetes bacterium]|nr:MAG: hypothetical protein D6675_02575 [Gemmatimonadota bacterium]
MCILTMKTIPLTLIILFLLPPLLMGQPEEVPKNKIKALPSGYNQGKVEDSRIIKNALEKIPVIKPGERIRKVNVQPAAVTKAGRSKVSKKLYIFKF